MELKAGAAGHVSYRGGGEIGRKREVRGRGCRLLNQLQMGENKLPNLGDVESSHTQSLVQFFRTQNDRRVPEVKETLSLDDVLQLIKDGGQAGLVVVLVDFLFDVGLERRVPFKDVL